MTTHAHVVEVLEVLAQPTRRRILDRLRVAPALVGELVADLGISQPLASKHLKVLRDAGLVEAATEGQGRRYRVRVEPLVVVDEWLAPYRWMWEHHVDRLSDHLDQLDRLADQERP